MAGSAARSTERRGAEAEGAGERSEGLRTDLHVHLAGLDIVGGAALLEHPQRRDNWPGHPGSRPADRKVLDAALGLRSPELGAVEFDGAKSVRLGPRGHRSGPDGGGCGGAAEPGEGGGSEPLHLG